MKGFHGYVVWILTSQLSPFGGPIDKVIDAAHRIGILIVTPLTYFFLGIVVVVETAIRFVAEHLREPLQFSEPCSIEEIVEKDPDNRLLTIPVDVQNKIFQILNIDDVFCLSFLSHDFRNTIFSRVLSAYVNVKQTSISKFRLNSLQKETWLERQGDEVRCLEFTRGADIKNAHHWITLCPNRQQLSIVNFSSLFDKDYKWLSTLVKSGELNNLSSLCLSCDLGPSDAVPIGSLTNLTHLNLSHNRIGLGSLDITANLIELKFLNLDCNDFSDDIIFDLAENLKNLKKLKEFSFAFNSLGPEGAVCLAEAFKDSTELTAFDIEGNRIGEIGAEAIGNNLKNLTYLNVIKNNIGSRGAIQIISDLKQLTFLHLADSFVPEPDYFLLPDTALNNGIELDAVEKIIDDLALLENLSVLRFSLVDPETNNERASALNLQMREKLPNCSISK